MRSLYIFGNGLGMALSSDAFNLPIVLKDVWDSDVLELDQKNLILACLPSDVKRPTSEEQLARLQDMVDACEILSTIRNTESGHWLSEQGLRFPSAIYRLNYSVARRMHVATSTGTSTKSARYKLPAHFVKPFADVIKRTSSHVATLNYDSLLASSLRDAGLFEGEDPILFDGFCNAVFDRKNLFRKNGFGGWYLHLHGSPAFTGKVGSKPRKISDQTIRNKKIPSNSGRHLVLTHFSHKPRIIASSEILNIYWEFLKIAINESQRILLFGYSGNDIHLNRIISQARDDKVVSVVDWLGSGEASERQRFWDDQFGGRIELTLLEDIFNFSEW